MLARTLRDEGEVGDRVGRRRVEVATPDVHDTDRAAGDRQRDTCSRAGADGPVAQERAGVDVLAAFEDADLAGVRGRALDGGGDRAAVLGGPVLEHATEVGAARVGDEQLRGSLAHHVAQG